MGAFVDYWWAGGPLMLPLFLICVLIWYAILTTLPVLRRALQQAHALQAQLHGCEGGQIITAVQAWLESRNGQGDVGRVARIVRYALDGGSSRDEIHERLAEASEAELALLRRHQKILRAFVAAAPLLGLLGTVQGMIATFTALSSRGTVSMEMLSGGISQALITTQVGLVIALPGLIGAHAIERRLRELQSCFDRFALHFSAAEVRERTTRMFARNRQPAQQPEEMLV